MNDDRGYGAMPKLYGAPAYARPPVLPVNPTQRPFDPDSLPLEAERALEDPSFFAALEAHASGQAATVRVDEPGDARPLPADPGPDPDPDGAETTVRLLGLPFRLRLPGRGRGDDDPSVGE